MLGTKSLGVAGEEYARKYLESLGWTLVAANLRLGKQEIDLLMKEGDSLVLIEVKTSGQPGIDAEDFFDRHKIKNLKLAALKCMSAFSSPRPRIDFVALNKNKNDFELKHFRDIA